MFRKLVSAFVLLPLIALGAQKQVVWQLPADWEGGVTYEENTGYCEVSGGLLQQRYDIGEVGEPNLPVLPVDVGVPSGGTFVGAEVTAAEWEPVEIGGRLPLPIFEPVQYGAKIVLPKPSAAYEGVYPSANIIAGIPGVCGGVTSVRLLVTPYRWVGAERRLYRAVSMTVTATLEVKAARFGALGASAGSRAQPGSAKAMALAGIVNPDDVLAAEPMRFSALTGVDAGLGEIIIISPSEFVELWKGYAGFRKSTEAGRNFKYTIVNTMDIYTNEVYWTEQCEKTKGIVRADNADALAIHHYLETAYDRNREQYIILGAAPAKYGYDRASMVPARYVINQNGYDEVCDMYYGCMDRPDGGETWDYDNDGYYMGRRNSNGSYTSDNNANIDWVMDVPVTRVPLMREVAETSGGKVWKMTAAQIMDNFTNRIAFAESEERWDYDKRWRNMMGGAYFFRNYTRESQDQLVRGEREFFDGGINPFDERHGTTVPDAEACLRKRYVEAYTYYRSSREALLYTGGYRSTDYATLYRSFGDIFNVQCHGWARGADPGNVEGVRFSTGLWRVFNMAIPCDSGMYDYGVGYGVTNCISMGEAPLLCFGNNFNDKRNVNGGLVTFNNTRAGWWSGYGGLSSKVEGLINRAFLEFEMNAGQACRWVHNSGDRNAGSRAGACNLQVVMHGDPLIRISAQYDRVWNGAGYAWTTNAADGAFWTVPGLEGARPMAYTKTLTADTSSREGRQVFDIREDFAVARLKLTGSEAQPIVLDGAGRLRATDSTVVTDADLVWNVAGGAGRMGVTFNGRRGNLTMEGNAKRYFGYKLVNVDTLNVAGGNVTFDFDHGATASGVFGVRSFSFVGTKEIASADGENYNVIRTRAQKFFPATTTIPVVSNCVELQTWNIGGGDADYRNDPLFYLTNAWLRVVYNPYRQTEYFVRPTYMTSGHIIGEYDQFGFGRPDMDGYDIYVWGKSSIGGSRPIMVTGELRIHMMDRNAELEISNTLRDGHGGILGRLCVLGEGKVRIAAAQQFTGGVTVRDSASLELVGTHMLHGVVSVQDHASLIFDSVPVDTISQVIMGGSSKLILPGSSSIGTYQVVDPATTKLIMRDDAAFYDAKAPDTPLEGTYGDGIFVVSADLVYWNVGTGVWKDSEHENASWVNQGRNPVCFTNGLPVSFGPIADCSSVSVAVDGEVRPGFVSFTNDDCPYVFGGTGRILTESLSCSSRVNFNASLELGNLLRVVGGETTVADLTAVQVEVATNAKFRVTGSVTQQKMMVRGLKFVITDAVLKSEAPAIRDLRFFRNDTRVMLPNGTVVRDSSGGEWVVTNGEFPSWRPSSGAVPAWFTISFPEDEELITGYAMRSAANWMNTPRAWSVYVTTDGITYESCRDEEMSSVTKDVNWLRSGDGSQPAFALQDIEGKVIVHPGGTLVADGTLGLNLVFERGSVLEIDGASILESAGGKARANLPDEDGAVLVDASGATKSSTPIAILKDFGLTAKDFAKFRCETDGAVIYLRGGNLYLVTDGIKAQPYTANFTASDSYLSGVTWTDATGSGFQWDASTAYDSSATAVLNIADDIANSTYLLMDIDSVVDTLKFVGTARSSITLMWANGYYCESDFVPRRFDFSDYAGPVDVYSIVDQTLLGDASYIAGVNTTIPYPSSGTLTIGAGKRAIIYGWNSYADVSGEGTLALWMQEGYSAVVPPRWAAESRITGTNELWCGTWTIANQNDYPQGKDVLVRGDKALLRLTTVNDTTGYEVCSNGLTVAEGGTLKVEMRDTFNRLLTLRDGGRLVFTRDASDGDRIFDFFEDAALRVSGTTPSVIGGTSVGSTSSSGVIALRNMSGLGVDVAAGSLLRVYSQWGAAIGTWNPWYKLGEGTIEFYRASGQSGNMVISNGVVRLVNRGQGTTGAIVNLGRLELQSDANQTQNVPNSIVGSGDVVKLGAGVTVLSGVNAHSGETRIGGGTLKLASQGALGNSRVVVEGGNLDLGTVRGLTNIVDSLCGTGFRIIADMSLEMQGNAQPLVRLGSFAAGLTDEERKQLFVFTVGGSQIPAKDFNVVVREDGVVEYRPNVVFSYSYPLEATVASSGEWSACDWHDQDGVAFTNTWAECPLATARITVADDVDVVLTGDIAQTVPRLTVFGTGRLTLAKGNAAFVIDKLVVSPGSSVLLGSDDIAAAIDAPAGSYVHYAADAMASSLRSVIPGAIVGYRTAVFDAALSADQWVHRIDDGDMASYLTTLTYLSADVRKGGQLTLGSGNEWIYGGKSASAGAVTNSVITVNGGKVICPLKGTWTSNPRGLILGNSRTNVGVNPAIVVNDGVFDISGGQIALWENATVRVTGGVLKAAGIAKGSNNSPGWLWIDGGILELGSVGIRKFPNVAAALNFTMGGGTVRAVENCSISVPMTVTGDSTLEAAYGKTLTVSSVAVSSGTLSVGTNCTLTAVSFSGTGGVAMWLTDAQLAQAGGVDLFSYSGGESSLSGRVAVYDARGRRIDGAISVVSGKVRFTPAPAGTLWLLASLPPLYTFAHSLL